jgi:hypothetical protein
MALETGTYISDLNSSNPVATDGLAQADDHIRLVKSTIKSTLPNITGAITGTQDELNILDGATVTTAELNTLDGLTASTTELNKVDGLTASTAELNKLDGLTASTAELNHTDGVTSAIQTQINSKQPTITGAATTIDDANLTANRALISNGSGKVAVSSVTSTELAKLDGLTASTTELNRLDGVTASAAELNRMDGITASTTELNHTDGVSSNIQTQLNAKASTSTSISAGGGLTGGGNLTTNRTISHSDTSSQGSVNNGGNTVIQDIYLDGYGHVTSIGSKSLSIPSSNSLSTGSGAWTDGSGGLQIRFGTVSSTSDGAQSFSFTTAFSSACLACVVGGEAHTTAVSRTGFTIDRENDYNGTIVFQYIALGY